MVRRERHLESTNEIRNVYRILVGNLNGRGHLEGLGVDGKVTLKFVLK